MTRRLQAYHFPQPRTFNPRLAVTSTITARPTSNMWKRSNVVPMVGILTWFAVGAFAQFGIDAIMALFS